MPIGLPDALTDDKTEYLSEWLDPYDYSDHRIYLDTGELPYRPPGRPVPVNDPILNITSTQTSDPVTLQRNIKALLLRHQRARRNRASYQSTLLTSESPKSSQENHSDSQASKDQVSSSEPREVTSTSGNDQGQPTATAEDTPLIHPWNRYNTSLIPQAAQADDPPVIHPLNRYKTSPVPQANATSPPQPANSSRPETQPAAPAATMSDRELILKGLLIFIVLAVMHRLLP